VTNVAGLGVGGMTSHRVLTINAAIETRPVRRVRPREPATE
jgi:hypothetical protein